MSADGVGDEILHETEQGVYGMQGVIADFDPAQLDQLRRVAEVIRTQDVPGVRSAIALAGSAAQSRFQLFPGDCDFFERVHLHAPTRDEAIEKLAMSMIETVARAFPHPDLQFTEMLLGKHPVDGTRGDEVVHKGEPVRWKLVDLDARTINIDGADGETHTVRLIENAADVGFVKLDWVFADFDKQRIVAVSKVIDATWSKPDGTIEALDGVVDSFYQEVYLDPDTRPYVERLIDELKPDGLEHYVGQLQGEIRKYMAPGHENHGKVAKRLYNIFRITNRPGPAAYLRQLFDDPPARLYQVTGALHALGGTLGTERLSDDVRDAQVAGLQDTLQDCYIGDDKDELVALVGSLPDLEDDERRAAIERISDAANEQVSDYFKAELAKNDEIQGYLAELEA
jgi:hypothetical protein